MRRTGKVDPLTHQPVKGRKAGGGVRFGEMERDALISHGSNYLLYDRLLNCSDQSDVIDYSFLSFSIGRGFPQTCSTTFTACYMLSSLSSVRDSLSLKHRQSKLVLTLISLRKSHV